MIKLLTTVSLFIVVMGFSLVGQAFTLSDGPSGQTTTGYANTSVAFDIDTSCTPYITKVRETIQTAADVWGHVPNSSLAILIGSTVTLPSAITTYVGASATQYVPAGNPIIYCDANFAANTGQDANSIPGFASSQNMSSSGQILTGLMVLNFEASASASLLNLNPTTANVVLTHEIGHVVGIGHSSDTNSLMYFQTGAGRENVLVKDDIDAVTYLYPIQELGGLACARVDMAIPGSGWKSVIIDLSLMAMMVYVMRRKSKWTFARS